MENLEEITEIIPPNNATPFSVYFASDGEFHVIHSVTVGDMMISILLVILLIVLLFSRLLGRSY